MSTQPNTEYQPPLNPFPPMPNHPPVQPKAKRKWLVPVLMIAALLIGVGFGSLKPAPDPVTIEKPVEKIVEKKVEVPVTPAVCGRALDLALELNGITSKVITILSDTLTAAGNLDAATIRSNSAKIPAETQRVKDLTPEYASSTASCRASLK